MYYHGKQGSLVLSSELQCIQADEISPLQSLPSFSDNFLMLSDVCRRSMVLSIRQAVQEHRAPYRSINEEGPIGARPLFVQHCYQDVLMGGLLSDVVDFSRCEQVLDVGCRTGDWICSLAQRYPQTSFIGVDRNEYSIGQARAQSNQLSNALFLLKDVQGIVQALQGTRRFDLVHLSFGVGDLLVRDLLLLVEALVKLCKPGGLLVWSETELPLTNSPACERFNVLVTQTMQMYGSAPGPGN